MAYNGQQYMTDCPSKITEESYSMATMFPDVISPQNIIILLSNVSHDLAFVRSSNDHASYSEKLQAATPPPMPISTQDISRCQ